MDTNKTIPDTLPANFNFGDTTKSPDTLPANFDFSSQNKPNTQINTGTQSNTSLVPFSDTIQQIQDYANMDGDTYLKNEGIKSHAFMPSQFSDSTGSNAGIVGVREGLKVIPNTVSDFFMNVVPGFFNIVGDAAKLGWYGLKGLPTGDYTDFNEQFRTGLAGSIIRDPSIIAGDAVRSAGFGVGKTFQDLTAGNWGKAGTDFGETLTNSLGSFIDQPISSWIAFNALGDAAYAVRHPTETINAVRSLPSDVIEKTKNATSIVTDPQGWLRKNMPATYQAYTRAGVEDFKSNLVGSIQNQASSFERISTLADELKTYPDKTSAEYRQTKIEMDNEMQRLNDMKQMQEGMAQLTLKGMQDGSQLHSPENTIPQTYEAITNFLDNEKSITTKSYSSLFGSRIPLEYDTLVGSLNSFLGEVNKRANPDLYDHVLKYRDTIKRNSDFQKFWDESNASTQRDRFGNIQKPDTAFIKKVREAGYNSELDGEMAYRFIKNPLDVEFQNPNLSQLKSEDFNNSSFNKLLKDATGGAKKLFGDTVIKAREKTINDALLSFDPEFADKYGQTNESWTKLRELGDLINKEEFKKGRQEDALLKNLPQLQKISPAMASMVRGAVLNKILKEAVGKDGVYEASKILDGVEKYRQYLSPSQTEMLTEQARLITDARLKIQTGEENTVQLEEQQKQLEKQKQQELSDIEKNQKKVGTNPTEVFDSISKIKNPEQLTEYSNLSGKTPEQIGNSFIKGLYDKYESQFGKIDNEDSSIEVTKNVVDDLLKMSEKGPESQAVIDQMFSKETQSAARNIKNAIDNYEKVKNTKAPNVWKGTAKIALGAISLAFKHLFLGTALVAHGIEEFKAPDLSVPKKTSVSGGKILQEENTPAANKGGVIKNAAKALNPSSNFMRWGNIGGQASNSKNNN